VTKNAFERTKLVQVFFVCFENRPSLKSTKSRMNCLTQQQRTMKIPLTRQQAPQSTPQEKPQEKPQQDYVSEHASNELLRFFVSPKYNTLGQQAQLVAFIKLFKIVSNKPLLIHSAVEQDLIGVVKCMLHEGEADVDALDEFGKTALYRARSDEMASLLLNSGADLHGATSRGIDTPLTWAAAWKDGGPLVSRLLLSIDPLEKNSRGESALVCALKHGQRQNAMLIINALQEQDQPIPFEDIFDVLCGPVDDDKIDQPCSNQFMQASSEANRMCGLHPPFVVPCQGTNVVPPSDMVQRDGVGGGHAEQEQPTRHAEKEQPTQHADKEQPTRHADKEQPTQHADKEQPTRHADKEQPTRHAIETDREVDAVDRLPLHERLADLSPDSLFNRHLIDLARDRHARGIRY